MARTIYHGEIAGSTDPAQLPNVPYRWGYIMGANDNAGNAYLGGDSDVKTATASTTDNVGFQLDANDKIILDMLPLGESEHPNLNELWYITDNSGDELFYLLWDW